MSIFVDDDGADTSSGRELRVFQLERQDCSSAIDLLSRAKVRQTASIFLRESIEPAACQTTVEERSARTDA